MSDKKMKSIIVPEKLSINHPEDFKSLHYFSIGEIFGRKVFEPHDTEVTFDINITKDPMEYWEGKKEHFSAYFTINDSDIFYERKYAGLTCRMLIKNFESDHPIVYVNKTYLFFVKFRMDNLYPVGVHLMDLFLLNILKKDDLVIHGASLHNTDTNDSFLILAPPDTGKTYSTAMLIEKGYKFLGEDLSYYDSKSDSLLCVPLTSTWGQHFSSKKFDILQVPVLGWFFTNKKEIVTDLFGEDTVVKKSKLARVYLIEKADENSIEKIEYDPEFLRKLIVIQRNEFTYLKNMLIRAFEYINNTEVDEAMQKENESFEKLLRRKELYIVKGKGYSDFHKLISQNESKL